MKRIKKVETNYAKKDTYYELNKICQEALKENNCFTVIVLSYAMIEDRFLSFLYYLYLIDRNIEKPKPSPDIEKFVFEIMKSSRSNFFNLSTKIEIITKIIKNKDCNYLSKDIYDLLDNSIGIEKVTIFLKKLTKWFTYRNDIIHASFNKSKKNLLETIEEQAKIGYDLSKQLSSFVNNIKYKNKSLRSQYELGKCQYA